MQLPISEDIRRNRGYASVLSAAFKAVSGNFKTIFRKLWPFALAFAIVAAFVLVRNVHYMRVDVAATMQQPDPAYWIELVVTTLLMIVTSIALYGRIAMLMNGGRWRLDMTRSLKLHVFAIAVFVIVMACVSAACYIIYNVQLRAAEEEMSAYAAQASLPATAPMLDVGPMVAASWIIIIVAGLLLLPYLYVGMKYLMAPTDGSGKKANRLRGLVFKAYGEGIRHYGYIFITVLLLAIIVAAVTIVVSIPMMLLVIALGMAVGGAAMGDELGLPGYFYPMMYAISVATYFILTAATVYSIFVMGYMYGSIETRIEEKRSLTEKQSAAGHEANGNDSTRKRRSSGKYQYA